MAGLASDLEGNAVGGSVLELEGGGGKVVEILVEELLAIEVSIELAVVSATASLSSARSAIEIKTKPSMQCRKMRSTEFDSALAAAHRDNRSKAGHRKQHAVHNC